MKKIFEIYGEKDEMITKTSDKLTLKEGIMFFKILQESTERVEDALREQMGDQLFEKSLRDIRGEIKNVR